jgi:hypothetical protein
VDYKKNMNKVKLKLKRCPDIDPFTAYVLVTLFEGLSALFLSPKSNSGDDPTNAIFIFLPFPISLLSFSVCNV